MPLDVLGRTRATLTMYSEYILPAPRGVLVILQTGVVMGIDLWNYGS